MSKKRITDVGFSESLTDNDSLFINQGDSIKQINKSNVLFGIVNGGTGATTAEKARANLGALGSVDVVDSLESTSADLPLSANKGNELNQRLIANDGTIFRFGVNENGEYGYIVTDSEGADTVIPFKNLVRDTQATATAAMITQGFTAWVNGELIVGTRPVAVSTLTGTQPVSFMGGGSDQITYAITFSKEFDTTPNITLTASWETNGNWVDSYRAESVTRTGFTLRVISKGGADTGKGINGTVTWYATV